MARFVELRRHTDNDGDVLSDEGVAAALELGGRLIDGYQVAVSTDAQRALAVGHTPTNEAAVLGLTGQLVASLSKGAGVLVTEDQGSHRVETLDP
jgi:hypothetical protein